MGFPRRKGKGRCRDSFRLRNNKGKGGTSRIRIGEVCPRSVALPRIGTVRVHDDTRRLRRLLRPVAQTDPDTGEPVVAPRAKVLSATISRHGARWYVSLNLQAPDFHAKRRHQLRRGGSPPGFVGVDRGLALFAVAATSDGTEVGRWQAPKPLNRRLGCDAAHGPCRVPNRAPGTAPRPPTTSPKSTPGSLTYDEASSTRSPAPRQDPRQAGRRRPRRCQSRPQQAPRPRDRRCRLGGVRSPAPL